MKILTKLVVAAGLALSAQTASAVIITSGPDTGLDVGAVDSLVLVASGTLGSCGPGSGEAQELCFVDQNTSGTVTFEGKTEDVTYYTTNLSGVYAFPLAEEPTYFLVKNSTYWALYTNNVLYDWGVLDTALLPSGINLDGEGTISHVSEYDGIITVPEPAVLGLLGLGLAGAAFARRRRA